MSGPLMKMGAGWHVGNVVDQVLLLVPGAGAATVARSGVERPLLSCEDRRGWQVGRVVNRQAHAWLLPVVSSRARKPRVCALGMSRVLAPAGLSVCHTTPIPTRDRCSTTKCPSFPQFHDFPFLSLPHDFPLCAFWFRYVRTIEAVADHWTIEESAGGVVLQPIGLDV
jgi:hypothetical protein